MAKKDRDQKTSWKRKVAISFIVFIILVIFAASFLGKRGWLEVRKAQKRKDKLQQEIELLEKKRDHLREEVRLLKEYPEAYEEQARKKLWLIKPGEKVVVEGADLKDKGIKEKAEGQKKSHDEKKTKIDSIINN